MSAPISQTLFSIAGLVKDFVALTKPRIISLLLVTTIAPMFVAGRPGWDQVLVVFVGGYLMAGGANAVNMYLDRDIDDRMARTRLRPIPSGRMQPREVLAFGLLLLKFWPSPYTVAASIQFSTTGGNTIIQQIDSLGRVVKTLTNQEYTAGTYNVDIYNDGLASGVYFIRLQNKSLQKVITVVKMSQ